jgi:hypothetical protein
VAVRPRVSVLPDEWPPPPPGVTRRRTRLSEIVDVAGLGAPELVDELATLADARAQFAAYEAVVVARFAALRPARWDRSREEPGHRVEGWVPGSPPAGVSEFFADELALVAGISPNAAAGLVERSLALVHQLPSTWAALADGLVDQSRATAIVKALGGQATSAGGVVDPGVVAEVEAEAVAWAAAGETPRRLQDRVAAALIAVDSAAADRRRKKAERHADVTLRGGADGMAELVADLPAPVAAACRDTVDQYARMAKADGDERPIGQLRAQMVADLILRPWDTSREPVTAHLTVLAPLPGLHPRPVAEPCGVPTAEDTATVEGAPITAGQLRELLAQLDAMCPGGLQPPAGGSLDLSLLDPDTGALRATVTRRELARLAGRGCPDHPRGPDHPGRPGERAPDCGCAVLDRPPPVDRYQPSPAQHRYVKARDRTCRHPGCRRPARWTDADHVHAHADGGATDCTNLCSLCRRHHRLKTHAPGWRFTMTADGVLSVTTPSGVTRTTRPPGSALVQGPAASLRAVGGTGVLQPPDADDAPPF